MCFSFVKNIYVNVFGEKNTIFIIEYSYKHIIEMKNNILYYSVQISYYCSSMFDLLSVVEQINICGS